MCVLPPSSSHSNGKMFPKHIGSDYLRGNWLLISLSNKNPHTNANGTDTHIRPHLHGERDIAAAIASSVYTKTTVAERSPSLCMCVGWTVLFADFTKSCFPFALLACWCCSTYPIIFPPRLCFCRCFFFLSFRTFRAAPTQQYQMEKNTLKHELVHIRYATHI